MKKQIGGEVVSTGREDIPGPHAQGARLGRTDPVQSGSVDVEDRVVSNPTKTREILILLLCIAAGFLLRFYTLDQKSLWLDEIHTLNDSKDGLKGQIEFYTENPTYLHPPLFFLMTHFLYPFSKPERDLRVIPMIFGVLCLPMMYLLARTFSKQIAIPCTLSLAFMTYHVSLSQDARPYSLVLFLGMLGLYALRKYVRHPGTGYLLLLAFSFALSMYVSYSSALFVVVSQILWFYRADRDEKRPGVVACVTVNGLIFALVFPWMYFLALHYHGQPPMDPFHTEAIGSPLSVGYGLLHDWSTHPLLMILCGVLIVLLPILARNKTNAWLLLGSLTFPIFLTYLFCRLFHMTHFVSSRYLVDFLPLFFITIYLSLDEIHVKAGRSRELRRAGTYFLILFVASNGIVLHFYYRSEKQNYRGLADYLKVSLRPGDKIFDADRGLAGILHYFGSLPEGRHYSISYRRLPDGDIEYMKPLLYRNSSFPIYHSATCCAQYLSDGHRLWIVAGVESARSFGKDSRCVLKGYFDGSFLSVDRFPTDGSMFLFLLDPASFEATTPAVPAY